MHFITFPVASTNIFPLSNSTKGGQLVTEFNLKSRDMVATNPNVKYQIGPSFIHSMDDFKIKLLEASDVPDYDDSKMYDKGDYCRYGDDPNNLDTYICIKDIRSYDDDETTSRETTFKGNGVKTEFEFESDGVVTKITSVTVDEESVPDTDYELDNSEKPSLIRFNTAPANKADIDVEYKIVLHTDPSNSKYWVKTSISTSILQIGTGRAVINGHYVESLAPMQVDLNLANTELKQLHQGELYGNLSIGIKSFFSTENTMAGSMLVENTDNMYVGIQLVIMRQDEFKTPNDEECWDDYSKVTADLKLADFTYVNGIISASSITPNQNATRYISSERIFDFDSILDDKYVTSENLVNNKLYTFSGLSRWWCDSRSSLMEWDSDIETTYNKPAFSEAQFVKDIRDNVHFVVPHKQMDGPIIDSTGREVYFADRDIPFPTANYNQETSGIVTKEYTQQIKGIANVINTYKMFTGGKQVMYLEVLTVDSDGTRISTPEYSFPENIDKQTNFNVGDYILVREDYTMNNSEDEGAAPATMYVVLPGGVSAIGTMTTTLPSADGIRLGAPVVLWEGDGAARPTPTVPDADELATLFNYTTCRGSLNDYFEIIYHNLEDTETTSYYYPVTAAGPKSWSDAILLTGGVPLASDNQVGGFYNATNDDAYLDAGYVYLDDTGHLKLMDYSLLRSGALAYQLGEDFSVPSNQTLEYIQPFLDENVNQRVAFKTNEPLTSTPTVININIPLSDEEGVLNIYDIDSRFGTAVYLHFLTDKNKDYSNLVINIINCEKIRIDSSITTLQDNGPLINIFRSCLYYDAQVLNYIRTCDTHDKRETLFSAYTDFTGFDNLTLWYARFSTSDPDLTVNGMEISAPNVDMKTEDITFWTETISDDVHYSYALRSITLSESGRIIGCSLYVSNNSTVKSKPIDAIKPIVIGGDFVLPQGEALNYPMACLDSPLMITGSFTTAYLPDGGNEWVTTDTSFTAKTGTYEPSNGMLNGSIAFKSKSEFIPTTYTNVDTIDGWQPGAYHIFYGGTTK